MRNQWVLVGILAGSLMAAATGARAAQGAEPAAATGRGAGGAGRRLALGTVRLPKAVTADGKPLAGRHLPGAG